MKRRTAFLFGSGISLASGAKTVQEITTSLLEAHWKPHTDSRFLPCEHEYGVHSEGIAQRAQDFLHIVKEYIDPHLLARERRECHYEDLYSAVLQMLQDETFEIVNPLIAKSLELIKAASAYLYTAKEYHIDTNRFASLADRTADLIQWVVYYSLIGVQEPVGLSLINEVAAATSEMDIFSLNHDLLIETQLEKDSIPFKDGFSTPRGDVFQFSGSWREENAKVRLLKLHGSINWYLYRSGTVDFFAKVPEDPDHSRDENGNWLRSLDPKPMFLTGTTVKEQSYGTGLFGELFTDFHTLLGKHRILICCGYGWGDKGINIRVKQWLRDTMENRIVILHNNPEEIIQHKRFWFWNWDKYLAAGKVVIIPKWLSECSIGDLEPHFTEYL